MQQTKRLFVGLMSGTSLDGVDAVLMDFSLSAKLLGHVHLPMSNNLREEFLALNSSGDNELHRASLAANQLSQFYAQAVDSLLKKTNNTPEKIAAIGSHGQTVRHRPQLGYTLQLNNPAMLAELTGIAVVADFRTRDLAAGGNGAPLVPPFHAYLFSDEHQSRAVLNIGGIANLTLLDKKLPLLGFDTGPGNALLDYWFEKHCGTAMDFNGEWGRGGVVLPALLALLGMHDYFSKEAPKSTGRDDFHAKWLNEQIDTLPQKPQAQDVQTTLVELTAQTIANEIKKLEKRYQIKLVQLIVCGGGAFNSFLLERIEVNLKGCAVISCENLGFDPLSLEAAAFAWLAMQCVLGQAASIPSVTGAKGARVLGALYPR